MLGWSGHAAGTGVRLVGSCSMRLPIPLALLLLAACGSKQNDDQPGVVANIMDKTLPNMEREVVPDNAIDTVEPLPDIPQPRQQTVLGLVPAGLQGRWTGVTDRCGDPGAVLDLTITPDRLIFHESVGTVTATDPGADGRYMLKAAFTGEGESWTRMLAVRLGAGGQELVIVNDGAAVTRKRC